MSKPAGRSLPLPLPRRLVGDLMHCAQKVPTVTLERRMNLAPLLAARRAAAPRPGWCAMFTKAFAVVAARHPELRRAYLGFPWPRLYEHPTNVAAITFERRFGGEDVPFVAHVHSPERYPLPDLDAHLLRYKTEPVERVASLRRALRLGRLPRPLRRLAWWAGFNVSGRQRARHLGTFGVTSTAAHGAGVCHLISPMTATLHYGLFDPHGSLDVWLTFDHRVFDGRPAARALVELEAVLLGDILEEVRRLPAAQAA
jgi:hypothetical protein